MSTPYPPTPYPPTPTPPSAMPPDSYLVWAVLVTCLCCLPGGIVAIVKGSNINALWLSGQYEAARQASESAKNWCIWSAVAGGVVTFLYALLVMTAVVADSL